MSQTQRKPAQNLPGHAASSDPTANSPAVDPSSHGPVWECQFAQIEGGPPLNALTVGAKFLMKCSGPSIQPWKSIPKIGFAQEPDHYSLAILEMPKAQSNSAEFVVTGYKAGEWGGVNSIGVGTSEVQVSGLRWRVQTVVEAPAQEQPAQPGQQEPKPFPPFGPQLIHWPWWLWAGLGVSIVLVGVVVWWQVRRYRTRQRLIEKIKASNSVLSPFAQLHRDLRALLRRYEGRVPDEKHRPEEYARQLNESFRQYISREFLVPATEWSDSVVMRDLAKHHKRVYKRNGTDLYSVLRELRRASQTNKIAFADCAQLHEMSRRMAERIERGKGALA